MKYSELGSTKFTDIAHPAQSVGELIRQHSRGQWNTLFLSMAALDAVMVYLAFQIGFAIRFQSSFGFFVEDALAQPVVYNTLSLALLPVWLLIFLSFSLYNKNAIQLWTREMSQLFNAVSAGIMMLVVADFLSTALTLSRGWIITTWGMTLLLVAIGRYVVRQTVRRLRYFGILTAPALIVGANNEGRALAEQFRQSTHSGLLLVGFADDAIPQGTNVLKTIRCLGGLELIDSLVDQYGIEELILTSSALPQEQIVHLFEKYGLSGQTNVRLSTGLYQIITTGVQVAEFARVPLVQINKVRLTGVNLLEKYLVDYLIAIPLTILLLPVFAVLAYIIHRDSPGPVFHRRRVMGVNGRQFDAFKFRTMRVDADEVLESMPELKRELETTGKLKDDPRVTRAGKILRKTSLDELPQIFNVLRNEMSIVGPRMISPPEMVNYKQHGMNLLTVKPGITGLWQVSGRSDVTYEERVRLDMYYIRNWTIWLDVQLLVRTIPAVLSRRGAY